MNTRNLLIDTVRKLGALPTDAAVADAMEVSRQLISYWRKGAQPIPDHRIVQLCKLAGLDAGAWMLAIHAENAGDAASRSEWFSLMARLNASLTETGGQNDLFASAA